MDPDMLGGRWTNVSADAKDMIRRLLDKSPVTRLKAKASLDHAFLRPIKE